MFKRYSIFFLIFFYPSFLMPQSVYNLDLSQQKGIFFNNWSYREGDAAIWSDSNYPDSTWKLIEFDKLPDEHKGIQWIRTKINITNFKKGNLLFLKIAFLESAYDIFWNGKHIGSNGKIGNNSLTEESGLIQKWILLDSLVLNDQPNILTIRFSNYNGSIGSNRFLIKLDTNLFTNYFPVEYLIREILHVGIGLLGFVFGFALVLSGASFRNYIYYALLCLVLLITKGVEFYLSYFNPSMSILKYFFPIWIGGFYLSDLALLLFLLFSFKISYKYCHTILLLGIILLCYVFLNYDYFRLIIFPYFISLTVFAIIKRKAGSTLALITILLYGLPIVLMFIGINLPSITFDITRYLLIVLLIVVSGAQVHEQLEIQKSLLLRTQKLETDLLKKSIQPHFIINTLASIRSLIKRKPDDAEKLINALAAEYRLINKISSEKEIPVSQEIELCESHLELMGYRLEAKYEMIKQNIDYSLKVPPLVFHTLIENGLTHAFKPKEDGKFWLIFHRANNFIEYQLLNNGSLLQENQIQNENEIEEGTGIKYVKTRLEERYPGMWCLDYGLKNNLWEVIIKING